VDLALFLLPSMAMGLLFTAHLRLVVGLFLRKPWWRGIAALLVPPLAPYWGLVEDLKVWSSVWLVGLTLYVAGFAAASAGG
jgi:hypothetical protein